MVRTVIFDIGKTLLDSGDPVVVILDVIRRCGVNPTPDMVRFLNEKYRAHFRMLTMSEFKTITEYIAIMLKEMAEKFGVPDMSGRANDYYKGVSMTSGKIYDDTIDTLDQLKKKGARIIVASDSDRNVLDEVLRHFKINNYFNSMVISSDVRAYKPSDKFTDALKKLKISSGDIFVGDSEADRITAQKVGAEFYLIDRTGNSDVSGRKIRSLKEIIKLV